MKTLKNLKLEELSVKQKIGMLLCARSFRVGGEEDLAFTLDLIKNHALGSVSVPYDRPDIMEKVWEVADYPIISIMDMEMGLQGSELSPIPMMTLSACNKPEYYQAFARAMVRDAKKAGYNGNWGPVIDILNTECPVGVHRKFSDDPDRVAMAAEELSKVFARNNFLSCGKHYPGGDRPAVDTHMANVASNTSREDLINIKLRPYWHLMKKGLLPSIMSGHVTHTQIDPDYPASLSKKTIDLIREHGFDGVCFSDSLAMMAIAQKFGEENILGMAVAAGNDIVLPSYRRTTRENYEMLLKNYEDGAFDQKRLDEAVRRVLAAQAIVGAEPEDPDLFTQKDLENYNAIARDCITAVTDPGVDAALPAENKDRLFVVITDQTTTDRSGQEVMTRTWYHSERIIEKIHKEFPEAEVVTLPEFPIAKENERVLHAATRHREVVFVTFCTTQPYLGSNDLTRRVESVINALIYSGKVSAVLHFGNPFAVRPLKHVPRLLFGYMMPESQEYAIEVLAGKLSAKGTLPFKVELS